MALLNLLLIYCFLCCQIVEKEFSCLNTNFVKDMGFLDKISTSKEKYSYWLKILLLDYILQNWV